MIRVNVSQPIPRPFSGVFVSRRGRQAWADLFGEVGESLQRLRAIQPLVTDTGDHLSVNRFLNDRGSGVDVFYSNFHSMDE
jgi:hypothetical protein